MTDPPRLDITPEDDVLVLAGEIDVHTAVHLDATILELGPDADVVLDLGAVQFMDSSGLRVLIEVRSRCEREGTKLVLQSPSEVVVDLLTMTGLLEHFEVT